VEWKTAPWLSPHAPNARPASAGARYCGGGARQQSASSPVAARATAASAADASAPNATLEISRQGTPLDLQLSALQARLSEQHITVVTALGDGVRQVRRMQEELLSLRMENNTLQAELAKLSATEGSRPLVIAGNLAGSGKSVLYDVCEEVEDEDEDDDDDDDEADSDNKGNANEEHKQNGNNAKLDKQYSIGSDSVISVLENKAEVQQTGCQIPGALVVPPPPLPLDVPLPPFPHPAQLDSGNDDHGDGQGQGAAASANNLAAVEASDILPLALESDMETDLKPPLRQLGPKSPLALMADSAPLMRGKVPKLQVPALEGDESQATVVSRMSSLSAPPATPSLMRWPTFFHAEGQMAQNASAAGRALFMDADAVKDKIRQHLIKPEVNVGELYKKEGVWQLLARNHIFEAVSNVIIAMNAIWIAVDTDLNPAPSLLQAPLPFQVAEQLFCLYFSFEWVVRFMAFERTRDLVKDRWFMFESALVALMVLETWVMTSVVMILTAATSGDQDAVGVDGNQGAVLRVLRLLRLNRAARIARVLSAIPELMVLVKGIVTAARSVFFTIALMMGIIYVFAVAFRELSKGTELEDEYFSSVPTSMTMLLLWGAFPDLVDTVNNIGSASPYLAVLFVGFIFLTSLTVMNMLIGVLVEMVSMVAAVEKEEIEVSFVKNKFLSMLPTIDEDGNMMISKDEFETLLATRECTEALQSVGVDVIGLVDLTDFIYMNTGEEGLSFSQIMDMVLNLRQKNKATVKDIVDLRKYIAWNLSLLQEHVETELKKLRPRVDRPLGPAASGGHSGTASEPYLTPIMAEGMRFRAVGSAKRAGARGGRAACIANGMDMSELGNASGADVPAAPEVRFGDLPARFQSESRAPGPAGKGCVWTAPESQSTRLATTCMSTYVS